MVTKKNKSKAQRRSNLIPITATFGKKKVKVGKVLKKANVTDTRIKTRKVVLLEQLKSNQQNALTSHRGLSLDDLCRRLGHYNEGVRRDAIIGVKEMLAANSSLIAKNLRTIIPCIGRLISAGMKEEPTKHQLRALLRIIYAVPAEVISSHIGLLLGHTLTALTDIRLPVKLFAFDVLLALMRQYPTLIAQRPFVFDRFLDLLAGERRPQNDAQITEAVALFRTVFGNSAQKSLWNASNEVKLSVDLRTCTPKIGSVRPTRNAIHFPVLYPTSATASSSSSATGTFMDNEARLKRLDEVSALLKIGRPDVVIRGAQKGRNSSTASKRKPKDLITLV